MHVYRVNDFFKYNVLLKFNISLLDYIKILYNIFLEIYFDILLHW